MAEHDLAIVNARVVTPTGVVVGGVGARDGKIAALLAAGEQASATATIDAGGRYLLPGLLDAHVHFRTPGLTHKEDWEHGSRAAAAGGVTTVIDMPNTDPPLLELDGGRARAELVHGHSHVDFRFHPGVDERSVDRIDDAAPSDVVSVKAFMTGHHTAHHVIRDPAALERLFARAAHAGIRVLLHAEDDAVFSLLDAARGDRAEHLRFEQIRPRTGPIVAVARVIELVRRHGTAAHVLHVSTAEEVELLVAAAATGLPVTFEVTAHHLSFTSEDVDRVGSRLWLSPAIRADADRERLWSAVLAAEVATIGSDHAPHTAVEKGRPGLAAPPGLPGVQELLPAVHSGLARRLPDAPNRRMELIARLLAATPADLFGLAARKGRIAVGLDADLVLFDDTLEWVARDADAHSLCGWSAYAGRRMTGRPLVTVRRGAVSWDARTGAFGSPDGIYVEVDRGPSRR